MKAWGKAELTRKSIYAWCVKYFFGFVKTRHSEDDRGLVLEWNVLKIIIPFGLKVSPKLIHYWCDPIFFPLGSLELFNERIAQFGGARHLNNCMFRHLR